jgi:hypothetical protein
VDWLLGTSGAESRWVNRFAARMGWLKQERDLNLKGWPWKPDNSAWVEPTAHALLALKKAAFKFDSNDLQERVRLGHAQLLDVRCADFGWNYGSRAALGVDLPSYPETTGLALLGLQGEKKLEQSLELAAKWATQPVSPLAKAWLGIALRVHGRDMATAVPAEVPHDLQVVALEALASRDGNYRLLRTEAGA